MTIRRRAFPTARPGGRYERSLDVLRTARALDPDVLCLQEVGLHPAERDQPDARRSRAFRRASSSSNRNGLTR